MSAGWRYCMFVVGFLSLAFGVLWLLELYNRRMVRRRNERERAQLDREYGA